MIRVLFDRLFVYRPCEIMMSTRSAEILFQSQLLAKSHCALDASGPSTTPTTQSVYNLLLIKRYRGIDPRLVSSNNAQYNERYRQILIILINCAGIRASEIALGSLDAFKFQFDGE